MKTHTSHENGTYHDIPVLEDISTTIRQTAAHFEEEVLAGFSEIEKYDKTITFFGSARLTEDSTHYQKAREVAAALCKEGFTIVTGGGGGIMEAGNRGSQETCGTSVGFNIQLPKEQTINPYVTDGLDFHFFSSRKMAMYFSGEAFIFFPGGYGTLDEFFQILTLIQTHKAPSAPVICVGSEFWDPLKAFVVATLLDTLHTISPDDPNLFTITDDTDEIVRIVHESA